MSPRVRVIAKIWAFSFAMFFIFFFVVHWYRYSGWVGFLTKNAFYQANFWSEWQTLNFNGAVYTATDRKIQLFNIDTWCYPTIFQWEKQVECVQKNSVTFDVFVHYKQTVPYVASGLFSAWCEGINRQPHGEYSVKWNIYSKPIQAVFSARDIAFLHVDNTLFACTNDYKVCHQTAPIDGDAVCSTKDWIVYNKDGKLFQIELE
jgi:hypothetical protein